MPQYSCWCGGEITVDFGSASFDRSQHMKCTLCNTPMVHPADYLEFREALGALTLAPGVTPTTAIERNADVMSRMKTYGLHSQRTNNLFREMRLDESVGRKPDAENAVENRKNVIAKIIGIHLAQLDNQERELLELGKYLETPLRDFPTAEALKWVQGPRKGVERAVEKTGEDDAWEVGDNKDWVRGTLIAESQGDLATAAKKIAWLISQEKYGFRKTKGVEKIPTVLVGNRCGYSDWNFNVASLNAKYKSEIQANTFAMIYAKEVKDKFMPMTQSDEGQYRILRKAVGLPGGLHHALYEIYRVNKTAQVGTDAADLSIAYCDICRNYKTKTPGEKTAVFGRLVAFTIRLASDPNLAKERHTWEHAGGPTKVE
jgi:hypothetical protein